MVFHEAPGPIVPEQFAAEEEQNSSAPQQQYAHYARLQQPPDIGLPTHDKKKDHEDRNVCRT